MINLEHNSQELFYRTPFGAVFCNNEVKLRIAAQDLGIPNYVKLMYCGDDEVVNEKNMAYIMSISGASIYETSIVVPQKEGLLWYWFELKNDEGTFYYGNNFENLGGIGTLYTEIPKNRFQITVYSKDYKTPDWFGKSIAYQIFPDRFYNEDGIFLDNRSDIIKREWKEMPFYKSEQFGGEYLSNDFFGGNINGIIKKLPYLEELGIGVIYLNPIFKAFSNHRYDTGDYETIDPMLGTEKDFEMLCSEAKKHGIKIVLDGVFNHTGSNSKYFNKNGEYNTIGAYNSKDSEYYNWYNFEQFPDKYDCWWGMKTLPNINEKSETFRKYILNGENSIIKRWIRSGASGWRLDVADELPGFFLKELRSAVKSVNDDAVIIGEVWEDASNKISYGERREYLLGHELDSVMNYPLKNAILRASAGKINAVQLDREIMSLKENYPKPAFYSLLNMISSHDSERALTVLSDAPSRHEVDREFQSKYTCGQKRDIAVKRLKTAAAMQLLLPGTPCIYYGDEIGMEGYADPFSRQTFKWEDVHSHNEVLNIYKRFINIRKSSDAFTKGDFKSVYKHGNVYAFLRENENECFVVIVNFGDNFENIRLDISANNANELQNIENGVQLKSQTAIYFIGINEHDALIFQIS